MNNFNKLMHNMCVEHRKSKEKLIIGKGCFFGLIGITISIIFKIVFAIKNLENIELSFVILAFALSLFAFVTSLYPQFITNDTTGIKILLTINSIYNDLSQKERDHIKWDLFFVDDDGHYTGVKKFLEKNVVIISSLLGLLLGYIFTSFMI